jgi:hypothetical protein
LKIKFENIYLSKWFYYAIIAVFLAVVYLFTQVGVAANNDFDLRFNPTLTGLIISFAIFIVFFDLREYLELKQSEKPLKARIGKQLYLVFDEVTSILKIDICQQFCGETEENWIQRNDKLKLEKLVAEGITIADDTWDENLIEMYSKVLDNLIKNLDNIDERYSKQLNSNAYLRDSIITLEDSLQSLKSNLRWGLELKDMRKMAAKDVEKIVGVISDLRKNKIDLGF